MTTEPEQIDRSIIEQLNEISREGSPDAEGPAGASQNDVAELGNALYERLEARITTFVEETALTQREAHVWVLINTRDRQNCFPRSEAIAMLLSTSGTEFATADGDDHDAVEVTTEDVDRLYDTAQEKYERACELVGTVTFPERNDVLRAPSIAWLNSHTISEIKRRRRPDDETIDDTVSRLLLETETRRSLEDYVEGYLDARGRENVSQVAIEKEQIGNGTLFITAHTGLTETIPEIVGETDAITVREERFDVHFQEDPAGPNERGRITLYASDNIFGMEGTDLDDGLAAAEEYVGELLDPEETGVTANR